MKIGTGKNIRGDFYIARVGSLVGKPMRENYTSNNAFFVESDNVDRDFQFVNHLYKSGKVNAFAIGTCQPSIRKRDMQMLIKNHYVTDETL